MLMVGQLQRTTIQYLSSNLRTVYCIQNKIKPLIYYYLVVKYEFKIIPIRMIILFSIFLYNTYKSI